MTRLLQRFCLGMLGLLCWPLAALAEEQTWAFTWEGAGGYELRGGLSFDAARPAGGLVTAAHVDCFFVEGFKDGESVGHWGLTMLRDETWWKLFFDQPTGQFLVEGMGIDMPQAWNMDGFGTSCGAGGFGFNIGSAAQDICIDGTLIVESQVDPFRPFPAERMRGLDFPDYACHGPQLMSRLQAR